jgi:hypothetical protein
MAMYAKVTGVQAGVLAGGPDSADAMVAEAA